MSNNNSSNSKDSPDDSLLSKIPSELRLTYKWDGCVERALAHTSVGTIAGGLVSVVLFKGPMLRFASTAFGAGFGAGAAWAKCSQEIEVEKKV